MSSDDALLTSLCGICHVNTPRYKCPRCGARTCSLSCVKKHKNWSSCNGERDPTVYIPPAKLRTDAGIDHDYNFLTKIERKVEQTEKILREERGILPNQKQAPPPNKRARLHKGQSRGRTTVGDDMRPWARMALGRLRTLGISVIHQPYGMMRAKENGTSFNKRTGLINWQVEWVFLDPPAEASGSRSSTRILGKMLENTPFHIGLADCEERSRWLELSQGEKEAEKKQRKANASITKQDDLVRGQDAQNSSWSDAHEVAQNQTTGCWNIEEHRRREQRSQAGLPGQSKTATYQYFFHVPGTPSKDAQKLIPAKPTDTLESVLRGSEVLEFPTIYVLPAGCSLPEGYVLYARPRSEASKKRKSSALVQYGSSEEDAEEGEISDEVISEEGSEANSEAGEGGDVNDDDTTSSSGSSDESDMEIA
ncbi:hypothetical protein BX600DRAFT_139521 [Xylariales sp. PMI_506]|nr:hypothetical protein BX600DRAFT_139521 [Xylariales sp. PMI_506]